MRPTEYKQHDKRTKYMTFRLVERKPKTTGWDVINNKSDALLGVIEWYGPWRQYTFEAIDQPIFNNACLTELAAFLTELNEQQRNPSPPDDTRQEG